MRLTVSFDYTCPYSYAAAVWLRQVEATEHHLTTEWRPFIVKEANRRPGEGVPFWEQAGALQTRTGLAVAAGAGIANGTTGAIAADGYLRTSAPNIFAATALLRRGLEGRSTPRL